METLAWKRDAQWVRCSSSHTTLCVLTSSISSAWVYFTLSAMRNNGLNHDHSNVEKDQAAWVFSPRPDACWRSKGHDEKLISLVFTWTTRWCYGGGQDRKASLSLQTCACGMVSLSPLTNGDTCSYEIWRILEWSWWCPCKMCLRELRGT